MDLLRIDNLHIQFNVPAGQVQAVRGVSFRIRSGTTVALVGESGSGKSVISYAIMGLLPRHAQITKGTIRLYDPTKSDQSVDIVQLAPNGVAMRRIRGCRISIIFQEPMTSLSPLHTIGDQISEAVRLHRDVSHHEAQKLSRDMLKLVEFPDADRALRTYPFELSGGLRQRAMIAMALVCHPALLIADEPTTALDVTIQAQILKLLKTVQNELGMAVLIITHDLGVVANLAEEIVVLYRGQVMEAGTLETIFRSPRHPYLKALMRAVPRFHMQPDERLVPLREIKLNIEEHQVPLDNTETNTSLGEPLLIAQNLSKRYHIRRASWFMSQDSKTIQAVDDIGFTVHCGECLGLVGESGCGKTTLSKILMRALVPDQGCIHFNVGANWIDLLALKGDDLIAFRRRLQFIFQDPFGSFNPRMTVFDIINEPLVIHNIGDAIYREEMVKKLVGWVGLDVSHLKRYPHSFSGGQRQRIGIARALALKPMMIICDEPVSALDVSIQAQILNLLKDLQKQLGLTYLFISHNLAIVDYMADRIMVMCQGRIVEIAPRHVLFQKPIHPYTQSLLASVLEPDPHHQLNFEAIQTRKVSEGLSWPRPFTSSQDQKLPLMNLGNGHFVRASAMPT